MKIWFEERDEKIFRMTEAELDDTKLEALKEYAAYRKANPVELPKNRGGRPPKVGQAVSTSKSK